MTEAVYAKIDEYWSPAAREPVMAVLDVYGREAQEADVERVHLAVLKLCDGDADKLPDLIRMAKIDHRDVLAFAEYPEEVRLGFTRMGELSEEARRAVRNRDRAQYLRWLRGEKTMTEDTEP